MPCERDAPKFLARALWNDLLRALTTCYLCFSSALHVHVAGVPLGEGRAKRRLVSGSAGPATWAQHSVGCVFEQCQRCHPTADLPCRVCQEGRDQ